MESFKVFLNEKKQIIIGYSLKFNDKNRRRTEVRGFFKTKKEAEFKLNEIARQEENYKWETIRVIPISEV